MFMERVRKVLYKGAWSLLAASQEKPLVETLHHRQIAETPEWDEAVWQTQEPAYIDPVWGYVITERGVLLEESLRPNFPHPKTAWRIALPSPWRFLKAKSRSADRVIKRHRVVSLRHLWEWNYYHFYLDVLGKLRLLAEVGIDRSVPLAMGRYMIELPYPQQIVSYGRLAERDWVVQDSRYVRAEEVIFCRTRQSYKERMDYLLDEMGIPDNQPHDGGRIFLTRGQGATRNIQNLREVEEVLQRYGFEVVDTAKMPVAEQIELFANTRHLVAIHGAGTTNIIFRRNAPLSVLELYPENYRAVQHERMGAEYGYTWELLSGKPDSSQPQHANFLVSPVELEAKVQKMIAGEETRGNGHPAAQNVQG